MKLDANATLFSITFATKDKGNIGNAIQINSDVLKSEAYDANDDVMHVTWRVNSANEGFELYQNNPNPFKHATVINYSLPQAMTAQFTISDVTGKVIKTWSVQGDKGQNKVEFNHDNLPTGILYYTIQAGEYVATKKMIVIE